MNLFTIITQYPNCLITQLPDYPITNQLFCKSIDILFKMQARFRLQIANQWE